MPYKDLVKRRSYQVVYQRERRRRLREREQARSAQGSALASHLEAIKAALDSLKVQVAEAVQANRLEPWRNRVNQETLKALQAIARALEALASSRAK